VEGEVVEAGEASLIDDRARDGGQADHGGQRGGEEAEWNGTASIVIVGVGGRLDVGDDAADGRKVSDG